MADPMNTGIYQIVNFTNFKRYVGSAVDFRKRWAEHRRTLRGGDHHSIALQRAWDLYGEKCFEFSVVKFCAPYRLLDEEQIAFDWLEPEYNICKVPGSTIGVTPSAAVRAKMSATRKGRASPIEGIIHSPEIRARMGAGKIGLKYPPRSDAHRQKLSESAKGHKRCVGRIVSQETREKIRQGNLGKRHTVEQRRKQSKLADDQVRQIRILCISGVLQKNVAVAFGVSKSAIARICHRERYDWVDPGEAPIIREPNSTAAKAAWGRRKAVGVNQDESSGLFHPDG